MKLVLTDSALGDLRTHWRFIAQDSVRAADGVLDRLDAAALRLVDFPKMGVARDDLAAGLRALRVDTYVIFYRFREEQLTVERVLHARLDVTQIQF